MNIPDNILAHKLETALKMPKPGINAQKLMMPENRAIQTSNKKQPIQSAVLIALYYDNNKIKFPLIRRPIYNGSHSGQMALPGGKYEPKDGNLINTALRESSEEVGINPSKVNIIGTLSQLYIPITNIEVLPVIGLIKTKPKFNIDPHEVDELFKVDLNDIFNQANKHTEQRMLSGQQVTVPFYDIQKQKVWGATAMILSELEQIIRSFTMLN